MSKFKTAISKKLPRYDTDTDHKVRFKPKKSESGEKQVRSVYIPGRMGNK